MRPRFREDKTTQAAAILIDLSGGKINYMVLIKLLYLADRAALNRLGQPISFDQYVSMPYGPALSTTLDLVRRRLRPEHSSYWYNYISTPERYSVSLQKPVSPDMLSDAEIDLLHEVHAEYGDVQEFDLVVLSHLLPEWKDPHGSSVAIDYEDVLRASGKDEEEISAILSELDLQAYVDERLSEEAIQR